jgi:ureidoglycolate hydrolase
MSIKKIQPEWITPEKFHPYGQIITAIDHGTFNGRPSDESGGAILKLQNGTPFFWGMRLKNTGLKVDRLVRHIECNQCVGAIEKDWYIFVAPPTEVEQPEVDKITAFRIPGNSFIKIGLGVWHAGPYFNEDFVDFYNLELYETGDLDYFVHNLVEKNDLEFEIVDSVMEIK